MQTYMVKSNFEFYLFYLLAFYTNEIAAKTGTGIRPQTNGYEIQLKSLRRHKVKATTKRIFYRNPEHYCAHYRAES